MVSAYPLSKTNQQHVWAPLKVTALSGSQPLIRINPSFQKFFPFLQRAGWVKYPPYIQSTRMIPPPRRLFDSHRQPLNNWRKKVRKWKMCPALNDPKYFNFCGYWPSPPLWECHRLRTEPLPLLKLLCPWVGFSTVLWQSFNTVWLQVLSPPLYAPNTYRPIDTRRRGTCTTLHMEMISINYHSP